MIDYEQLNYQKQFCFYFNNSSLNHSSFSSGNPKSTLFINTESGKTPSVIRDEEWHRQDRTSGLHCCSSESK